MVLIGQFAGDPTERRWSHESALDSFAEEDREKLRRGERVKTNSGEFWLESPAVTVIEQPATELGEVLSPSQLTTWMDCQARWMFKYLEERPDDSNSNLALGGAVHRALARNFQQKIDTGVDLPVATVLESYCADWSDACRSTDFAEHEDALELGIEGGNLVEAYMRDHAPAIAPAAVEVRIGTGPLGDVRIGGVRVRGIVDILDVDGRIIDLKVRKRSPSKMSNAEVIQVATYAAVTPGAQGGKVRVDTLVRNKKPVVVSKKAKLTERDFVMIENLYPQAQAGMRSGYYMPNRTSVMCSRANCPFWRACESEFGGIV